LFLIFSALSAIFGADLDQAGEVRLRPITGSGANARIEGKGPKDGAIPRRDRVRIGFKVAHQPLDDRGLDGVRDVVIRLLRSPNLLACRGHPITG